MVLAVETKLAKRASQKERRTCIPLMRKMEGRTFSRRILVVPK
jgi:hypothetical protein